ncbi:MAG TPA: OsmC family protein [Gemmatimonadota bacterium]|nr:OsmC family protein [Gemmatimonadota bacterium]
MSVTLAWEGDMRFRARTEDGHDLSFDGTREMGASPTEGLLASLAACMAIDVVDILEKGRQDVDRCDVAISGERRKDPPRRFTSIRMEFRLSGKKLSRSRVERAIDLSRTTYCSVWHTLAPDIELDIALTIEELP